MYQLPKIKGIAATDKNGCICYESTIDNRKELYLPQQHTMFDKEVETFDNRVLRDYINKHPHAMFVCGETTQKDMGKLLSCPDLLISKKEHKGRLLRLSMSKVLRSPNINEILVLGGRSVYNEFSGHYDEFVHVEFLDFAIENLHTGVTKKIKIEPDSLDDKSITLFGYNQAKCSIIYNDGKVKISVYKQTGETL